MPSESAVANARTLLFVPGHRPDRFTKAAGSGADGIILDLEDAVAPDQKAEARQAVSTWLRDHDGIVRINAWATSWYHDDLTALDGAPRTVMLPKATPDAVADVLGRLPAGSRVVALVETAAGVLDARALAAIPGVVRLAFGNIDLAAELGIDPDDHTALLTARSWLVLAAAAAALPAPLDGVTASIDNSQVLNHDVGRALALGFTGKLCIHPRQVSPIHDAFAPDLQQIRYSESVMDAAGDGAVTVLDGQMIDKPVVDRARRILALAARGR